MEGDVPIEVQVQLDRIGPLRVLSSDMIITPTPNHLIVEPRTFSMEHLKRAATIATRAMRSLPETPLTAVGVNLVYNFDEVPDEVMQSISSPADQQLADADFRVVSRHLKRGLHRKDGVLNLEMQCNEDLSTLVTCNFHRQSSVVDELASWLDDTDAMFQQAKKLLIQTFQLKIEDFNAN
jgi:hypothetical protein